MFSQTAEYALRAVVWLASHHEEQPIGATKIALGTKVPESYLSKILQELVRSGIVNSRRGVNGGFALSDDPDNITVLDVINSVDPLRRITGCPLHLKTHQEALCPMHHQLDQALKAVEDTLGATPISQILRDDSRPRPMIETS